MIAYAISDSSTLDFNNLKNSLYAIFKKANMVVYRDKTNPNYSINAALFIGAVREFKFSKVLIHNDVELALKLKADGVHLTSSQFDEIQYAKSVGLFVIISTHTKEDALKAQKLGADMITLSPIYDSPNKGKPIGLEMLKEIVSSVKIPVIALGGILTIAQIKECESAGASGFASIRYFIN